jgi:hypothetical protein
MKAQGSRLLAEAGWFLLTGTSANTTTKHYGFMPSEDTVIAAWSVTGSDGGVFDVVAHFGIASATITTAMPALIIPAAYRNSGTHSITLTSGAGVLLIES